jgi:hypothetical protein
MSDAARPETRACRWPRIGARVGEEDELVSVKRSEDHLVLRIRYEVREYSGRLQSDPPPLLMAWSRVVTGTRTR